jgi:hypothetical protein
VAAVAIGVGGIVAVLVTGMFLVWFLSKDKID